MKMSILSMTFYVTRKKNKFHGYLYSLTLKRHLILCSGTSYMPFQNFSSLVIVLQGGTLVFNKNIKA